MPVHGAVLYDETKAVIDPLKELMEVHVTVPVGPRETNSRPSTAGMRDTLNESDCAKNFTPKYNELIQL